jgi:hypothetical protein
MSNLHHDQAVSRIQFLLERLGFRIDADSPPTAGDDNEKWRSLPQAVQTVIFPSRKNRSMAAAIHDDLTFDRLIATKKHDIAIWLWTLTIILLMMSLRDPAAPNFFQCCASPTSDLTLLCKFMLPSLCFVNLRNSQFRTFPQNKWNALIELLTSEACDFVKLGLQTMFDS